MAMATPPSRLDPPRVAILPTATPANNSQCKTRNEGIYGWSLIRPESARPPRNEKPGSLRLRAARGRNLWLRVRIARPAQAEEPWRQSAIEREFDEALPVHLLAQHSHPHGRRAEAVRGLQRQIGVGWPA